MSASKEFNVIITSFGYKAGLPPQANITFDVRFLKNPFWVPELKELTGLDKPVKEYVLSQQAALEFLDSLFDLISLVLPQYSENGISEFTIALGCTGGQHRSTTLVETLADKIEIAFPHMKVSRQHRELSKALS